MPLKHAASARSIELPSMNVPATQAFLGDVYTSNDTLKQITCGFFRIEQGLALVYDYDYDEMKMIVEGEMIISDETGQSVQAKPGDVLYFERGSRITFASPTYGIGFFCGQRPFGEA